MTHQETWTPDGPLLPYPGRTQPPKRSKLWLWITLGVAIPVIAGLVTWYAPKADHPAPVSTSHTVTYQADGAGARGLRSATYTLQTPSGTAQGAINLPLMNRDGGTGITIPGFNTGDFVYLSVQNADAAGSVTCRILVDGVMISENTSSGGYTIATCKGQVP